MNLQQLFNRVAVGMAASPANDFEILAALSEELGEYALARRVEMGLKRRTLKEPASVEAIDILLIAVEAYIHSGGTAEELETIVDVKLKKWEASFPVIDARMTIEAKAIQAARVAVQAVIDAGEVEP
jgi:hypothetical protein